MPYRLSSGRSAVIGGIYLIVLLIQGQKMTESVARLRAGDQLTLGYGGYTVAKRNVSIPDGHLPPSSA